MLTALISLIVAVSGLVLILLAVVVAGTRRETPTAELNSRPPSVISAIARRLTGVYVRRPDTDEVENQPDPCLTATSHEGR
jgi:hypothetical protein